MNNKLALDIKTLIKQLRNKKTVIHHLTNYVTANDCANIVLAVGGSPIMADDINEVAEITRISSALVLNIGTLSKNTVSAMIKAGKTANINNIPVILDPVGAGVSTLRNKTIEELLKKVKISVLRGNISEIRFAAGFEATTKGVDASTADIESRNQTGEETAIALAKKMGCVVAITGSTDIISNGERTIFIENGHKMLTDITGTGCMSTSLIGSFCAVSSDCLISAVAGILCMGIAGEIAFGVAGEKGVGSFRTAIFDSISKLDGKTILERAKIYEK